MLSVEYYYDIVCPYAYLGSTQIERIAAARGATVMWRPFLLGGVLKALGGPSNAMEVMSTPKQAHNFLDMHRWAEHFGVPLKMPAAHPRRSVLAMRALVAIDDSQRPKAMRALFRAYWVDGVDVADRSALGDVLANTGLDATTILARTETETVKQDLRARTDEALARGVFGAPTMFVGNELFWGQDRLMFVERALEARAAHPG